MYCWRQTIVDVYYRTETLPKSLLILKSINVRSERTSTEIEAVLPHVWSTQIKELRWFEKFKAVLSTRSIEVVCSSTEFRFPTDRGVGVDNRVGAENVFISQWMKSGKIFVTGSDVPSVAPRQICGQKNADGAVWSGHVAELGGIFLDEAAGRLKFTFSFKEFFLWSISLLAVPVLSALTWLSVSCKRNNEIVIFDNFSNMPFDVYRDFLSVALPGVIERCEIIEDILNYDH